MSKSRKITLLVVGVFLLLGFALMVVFRDFLFSGTNDKIKELLRHNASVKVNGNKESIKSTAFLSKYYDYSSYKQTWSDNSQKSRDYRAMLKAMLNYADSLGLERKDYHENFLLQYDSIAARPDFERGAQETESELIFTDAAISVLFEAAYGKELKDISYNGVSYSIDSARILRVFNDLLVHQDWRASLDSLEPKIPEYRWLKNELNRMSGFLRQAPDTFAFTAADKNKGAAVYKMKAYGLLNASLNEEDISDDEFTAALKGFQQMVGLDSSGKLDKPTVEALSFPIAKRVEQIKQSLNIWRWTGRLPEQEFILVNIPAARLQIVNRDSARDMSMRVIVGKASTKTPSFTAYITKVITYPYWTVPFSIATKEMIPKIRKNIGYLDANSLQVINNKGQELDARSLPWYSFSSKYFPYTIRQSTGCDNSLGVMKFDINSPYSIYLHDTNNRNLFANQNRFISHGCVRVEKPTELAHFILENGMDATVQAKLDSCMKDQKPTEFKLKRKFPVLLLYMTADIDQNGQMRFYKDVYNREK